MSELTKLLDGVTVEWKTLGEISELYGGLKGKSKNDFTDGNAKYVTYKNIFNNIEINFDTLESVKVSPTENQYEIRYGDVLFTGSSEIASEAGMSSSVTKSSDTKIYLNSFSFGLRFNPEIKLIPEFTKYLFRSKYMRDAITKTASGVTRYNISKKRFVKLLIPIPCPDNPEKSLRIQQEIVRILDRLSEETNQLNAALQKELQIHQKRYDFYREELFKFEDKDVEWKFLANEIYIEIANSARKPIKASLRSSGNTPYYGANNIQDYVEGKTHSGEYVLIAEDGSSNLNNYSIQYAQGDFWANNHVHVLRGINGLNTKFLFHCLKIVNFIPYLKGGERAKLTKGNLLQIQIPIPCPDNPEKSLKIQQEIVRILDRLSEETKQVTAALQKEIVLRSKQYEYYRDKLLSFQSLHAEAEAI